MKVLVLGDIHGRNIWLDIIQKEQPDMTIFLGDYVSTHEGISAEEQLSNLEDILNYKDEHPGKVILLRGNHDEQHCGYYWAECSGYDPEVAKHFPKERFEASTQWIYLWNGYIFSHAGVSQVWLDNNNLTVHTINDEPPSEKFGFNPGPHIFDMCGDSETQPPTWIRPTALITCNVIGYHQVVGHTPVRCISKFSKNTKGNQILWLCDNLADGEYLIFNGTNDAEVRKLNS